MDSSGVALGILITIVPFFLGLLLFGIPLVRKHPTATLALALGMSFYFLFDGFNDSAQLGVNQGFLGGLQPLVLVAAFAVTFATLSFARRSPGGAWPLWIIAVGISIHSFSEASDVSSSASLYFANLSSVEPSAATFLIHKFLEGFVLVAAAVGFGTSRLRQVIIAGSPMIILATAGSLAGAFSSLALSPFIASGVGGWMFVTAGLGLHLDKRDKPDVLLLILAGFIIVYSGALLHYTSFA